MPELDKYIKHHPLTNKGKKPGKIRCITLHLSAGNTYMGPQDNIQEEDEEESQEEVVLAEVDSGNNSTDSYLDSESTDNESVLTDVSMPSGHFKYQIWKTGADLGVVRVVRSNP